MDGPLYSRRLSRIRYRQLVSQLVDKMPRLLFCLVLIVSFSLENLGNQCPEFITCESSEKPDSCQSGTFYREKVKVYGCCPGCVPLKGKNQPCNSPKECEPGLTCKALKKCVDDPLQACEDYKRTNSIYNKNKYWKPECLPDGKFAPKQCKGEKMAGKCFCVSEEGKRIFGEEEWHKAENMTCACSRLAEEMRRSESDVTLHCDHWGNFEPLQCDQKVCWCASPKTGIPYTVMVPLEMMASLPCYKRNEVGIQYHRQCDSGNHMREVIKSLLNNHGTKDFTPPLAYCNGDGSYHRVQPLKEKTRCVFTNNSPLTEAVDLKNANCNCAYDRHIAKLGQVEFPFDCLSNGNYRNRQIWGGKIYCVDDDGFLYSSDETDCPAT